MIERLPIALLHTQRALDIVHVCLGYRLIAAVAALALGRTISQQVSGVGAAALEAARSSFFNAFGRCFVGLYFGHGCHYLILNALVVAAKANSGNRLSDSKKQTNINHRYGLSSYPWVRIEFVGIRPAKP